MSKQNTPVIKNKRAAHEYFFIEEYEAGIVLTGTEIKSIRLGKASLVDSFCTVINGELWVKNMYVAEYFYGTYNNHVQRRDRKLLLNRKELNKIESLSRNTGFTIIPYELFINENGRAKLKIAVSKGKKSYDKRNTLREKDDKREISRALKSSREL